MMSEVNRAQREALVVVEVHLDEPDEKIRGRNEWAEQMHRLADHRGTTHLRGCDAIRRAAFARMGRTPK